MRNPFGVLHLGRLCIHRLFACIDRNLCVADLGRVFAIKDFDKIGAFMREVGLNELNILPFHRLGVSKWEELSMTYAFADDKPTPPEKLESLRKVVQGHGVRCYVGSETPF